MKYLIIFILIIRYSAAPLFGQAAAITKTGTTAASFLKIGVGARALGLGGAFTAVADDISAIYWNPAGIASLQNSEAMFHHVNWIADVAYDAAAVSFTIDGFGTIAGAFGILSMNPMEITTAEIPEGTGETFSAGSAAASLAYGKKLTDRFMIGGTVKYVREYIWNESASSIAVDFGTLYNASLLGGVRIGASIANFGPKMKMEGRDILRLYRTNEQQTGSNVVNSNLELESFDLPLLFRVGVSTDPIDSENSKLTLAVDAIHPNDNSEYVNGGIEYRWARMISVRGGWKSAFEKGGEQGLTAGFGVAYGIQSSIEALFDYAYQDFGRLKAVHYFSVGLRF